MATAHYRGCYHSRGSTGKSPTPVTPEDNLRLRRILWRSLRLKCCFCGNGRLFQSWFKIHTNCSHCGSRVEREPGFFLGSIYIHYTFTALSMTIIYVMALVQKWGSNRTLMWYALVYTIVMPAILFPFVRSFWLGFDNVMDPRRERDLPQKPDPQ